MTPNTTLGMALQAFVWDRSDRFFWCGISNVRATLRSRSTNRFHMYVINQHCNRVSYRNILAYEYIIMTGSSITDDYRIINVEYVYTQ